MLNEGCRYAMLILDCMSCQFTSSSRISRSKSHFPSFPEMLKSEIGCKDKYKNLVRKAVSDI